MALIAEGVGRRYFRQGKEANVFTALVETDFTLAPQALTEICGRSGSGKSTLLHILGGLLAPSTGRVMLDGADLYALDDEARSKLRNERIGVITQSHAALASLTVWENVLLPCAMYDVDGAEAYAEELLSRLGIAKLRDAMPNNLSGGELRRLSIARALVRHPDIVLADEPTGDLDDENTETVLTLLKELAGGGAAVLLVTHEREAERYADRVFRMDGGRLAAER